MRTHHSPLKSILITLALIAIFALVAYNVFPLIKGEIQHLSEITNDLKDNPQDLIQSVQEEIFSSPLTNNTSISNSRVALTRAGVIFDTNTQRIENGRVALKENTLLNKAAEAKLKDMFDNQYFEHVSPDGHGPGYVVSQAGYIYVVVGENLALGNFKNDQDLVTAWMNSEGHRENILNERFTQIGVAVGQGMFNGKKVWLAVQEFGKPASECPAIDASLKKTIDQEKVSADEISKDLADRKQAMATMPRETAEQQAAYNQKVEEYNAIVKTYNETIASLHAHVDTYNEQVRAFNACVKK